MTDLAQIGERFPHLVKMATRLHEAAQQSTADPASLQMEIVGRMLEAESEEDLFARQDAGTVAAKDWLNQPFRLRKDGVSVRTSALDDSTLPWYVLLSVTDFTTGEAFTINTGAPSVIAILDKLIQWDDEGKGSFSDWDGVGGRAFQFVGKAMGSGNELLHIIPLEKQSAKKTGAKK